MSKDHLSKEIVSGIPNILPEKRKLSAKCAHAPKRNIKGVLSKNEKRLAVKNALRYFHPTLHKELAKEFFDELNRYGRIYMYRFRPDYEIFARPVEQYPAKSHQAAAIMLMIQNNLDFKIAKYPEELITYGGNGSVF